MKKLIILLLVCKLATGAWAQRFGHGGYYRRPRVSVGIGLGTYVPFGYGIAPVYGYPRYRYGNRVSKLDREITDIKLDYKDKIWAVKHDTSLPHKERRMRVRELKHERAEEIIRAKREYYKY